MLAYLKLEDYEEARFWGNRTIDLIQQNFEQHQGPGSPAEEQIGPGFPAAEQMGKIYYRTALAAKAQGDDSEARRHLAVASRLLPHDPIVRKERERMALPLM